MKSVIFSLNLEIDRIPIVNKNFKPTPLQICVYENYFLVIILLDYLLRQLIIEVQKLVAISFVLQLFDSYFDDTYFICGLHIFSFRFIENYQKSR